MPGSFPVRGRRVSIITASALTLALLPAGAAHAASPPVITKVSPMQVEVGQTLKITGRGFRAGANRNVVAFKRSRQPAVFVNVPTATTRQLTLPVPVKLLPFLKDASGKAIVVRFRLRVLSKRFGKSFTATKLSPRVGPPGSKGDTPGAAPPADPGTPSAAVTCGAVITSETNDADKDGMSDALETRVKTDPCKLDTDGDGVSDGFEYESALDLNSRALPYPGKKPYPNPLDGTDAAIDFDQDGLSMTTEYSLWMFTTGGKFPLTYSDGDQDTNPVGSNTPVTVATASLDLNQDGFLTDDEKDADGDLLTNFDETRGRMKASWWGSQYPTESQYVGKKEATPLAETSPIDPDSDGDGVLDGADDQDHDGWTNLEELDRSHDFGGGTRYWVHPYNPCLPDWKSRVCTLHPPFTESWAPFDGATTLPAPPLILVPIPPGP